MGAAASVPAEAEPPAEGAEGPPKPADVPDEHKALVYDACYTNFEKKLLPKPRPKQDSFQKATAKPVEEPKRNSLFAEKKKDTAPPPSEEPDPVSSCPEMEGYAGPFYEDLTPPEKIALLKDMRVGGLLVEEQIHDGTWGMPETPPCLLHYKLDVFDKVRESASIMVGAGEEPEAQAAAEAECLKIIEMCREMIVAAYVAATRLEAAMRGRQARMAGDKKGKKGKKGKKK